VTAKAPQRREAEQRDLAQFLPTDVQKSYFMLSVGERAVLNSALEKHRPSKSEPILVGGVNLLKPALRLMSVYRLKIEEPSEAVAVIYTVGLSPCRSRVKTRICT
jgi:hypothetical protein